jgi:hypothetical protein
MWMHKRNGHAVPNSAWKTQSGQNIILFSGVHTTMGSERENPGAPMANLNGGPGLGDRAKTLARASNMLQCRFLTIRIL